MARFVDHTIKGGGQLPPASSGAVAATIYNTLSNSALPGSSVANFVTMASALAVQLNALGA